MNDTELYDQSQSTGELIRKCRQGDLQAFRSLIESHRRYIYALAFRILRREDDASDVVQETFIRIWKHLPSYKPHVKFTTWVYTITVHLCYDRIKMDSRRPAAVSLQSNISDQSPDDPVEPSADPQTEFEGRDLCDRIASASSTLPPMERLVFQLRDFQDFTVEEIAEIAGISAGSVRTNLCYARKRLRTIVRQLQGSGL